MENLKLVIFDMDGLMFNTERTYCDAIEEFANRLDVKINMQPLIDVIGSSLPLKYEDMIVDKDKITVEEFREKILKSSHEEAVENMCQNGVPIKKGLFNLMNKLQDQGIKMCVATSTAIEISGRLLDAAKVREKLDFVITRKEVERGKPFPDIFLKACELANVSPNEALVLEDSSVGARAALNGGIRYIVVPDIKQPDVDIRENCVKVCQDLDEVCELI